MADALAKACPDVVVSVSSAVSPQMREFERFNTVIANAYVQPMAKAYLGRLVDQLRRHRHFVSGISDALGRGHHFH